MTTILAVLILAMIISVISTLLMIRVSVGFGIMDRPDQMRHFHGKPVPKLGGVAVFVAFAVPIMLLMHLQEVTLASSLILGDVFQIGGLLIGSSVVLVIGLFDDILDLRPRWKVLWQVISAAVAYKAGFVITALTFPLLGVIELGALSFPVTVLWFLMCMNAVNLLDGHDGLAAGACLFVGLTLMLISLNNQNTLGALLMAALVGSITGFLFFNFPPAKIFLGDTGSLLLGFLIAGLSLVGATMKAETAFSLLVPIVAMGLPFFDTLFAIMRRVYARMPISMGDRGHVHHLLAKMGYSSRSVVLSLYGVTMALCALAFVITVMRNEVVLLIIIGLVMTAFVTIRVFSGITPGRMAGRYVGDRFFRSRVVKARLALQNNLDDISHAASVEEVWFYCNMVFEDIGIKCAHLRYGKDGNAEELFWPADCGSGLHSEPEGWTVSIPLDAGGFSGRLGFELGDSEHNGTALPEFTGLMERVSIVLSESIQSLPFRASTDEQQEKKPGAVTVQAYASEENTFFQRGIHHIRRYGLIHALASFAGRFSPSLWSRIGPSVTHEMIDKWLASSGNHILNLGGGSNNIEGCLTVDVDPRAEVYIDIRKRLPIPDASVDGVFCEEVIEHLSEEEGMDMLEECLRILKPGGVIRLITPDLDCLAQNAADGGSGERQINEAFLMHEHRHLYSRTSLKQLLEGLGFDDVKSSSYKSSDSELGQFDSHAERFNHPPEISQYIEARKPDDGR